MRQILILALLSLAAAGCQDRQALGCDSADSCPAGHVCRSRTCAQLCSSHSECAPGTRCNGETCEPGAAPAPSIRAVYGNTSTQCPGAANNVCFRDGIYVEGDNLDGGTTFVLARTGVSHDLVVRGFADSRVELELPRSLTVGSYTLTATNAAGSDQQGVSILQGEPGPNMTGNEIVLHVNNGAGTARFSTARLPTGNDLIGYLNADANGTVKLDADLLPAGGGSMTGDQIVTALNGSATTRIDADILPLADALIAHINTGSGTPRIRAGVLEAGAGGSMTGAQIIAAINAETTAQINGSRVAFTAAQARFHMTLGTTNLGDSVPVPDTAIELCRDVDGCDVSLGVGNWNQGFGPTEAVMWGPPCRFHVRNNHWVVDQACGARHEMLREDNSSYVYRKYNTGQQGIDGQTEGAPLQTWRVLRFINACVFSEGAAIDGTDQADNTVGFHFWMMPGPPAPADDPYGTYDTGWIARGGTCEMTIAD